MMDDFLTEEEKKQMKKRNDTLIDELRTSSLRLGRVIVHISETTLVVNIRNDVKNKTEEYLFFSNGKVFRKVS